MPKCSVCGRAVSEERMSYCSQCGRAYCERCAEEEPSMAALGVCPDCEEAWQAEDDMDEE
ncbi:MAG: hypothetical protein QW835_07770 [Candidatus Hadarchaeum sp.]|uniref:hypothetical protein n=1 Tax=Candidatus Hadarchaeum sp. TaxID=2883567 RepID=UPI00317796CA